MKLLYNSFFLSIASLSNSRYSSCANEISTSYRDFEIAPFQHLYNELICIKRVIACKQCASFTIPATVSYTMFWNIDFAFIYIFEKCWEQLLTYIFKVRYLKDCGQLRSFAEGCQYVVLIFTIFRESMHLLS